ncbi:alpha/beta hydrolase [Evansella sp. AB-P1]|uniref:alpha/beta fold hydrolase n=1 Tax=Evansella sp. AB-P1 TaxID=3037653 RepID=UPI00241FBA52|nr:alpha/beta hydrolase [Evansella sp. AB-P1]MDG5789697.1 alpha/beta hydrolase [Evansella sp. AB-P1]
MIKMNHAEIKKEYITLQGMQIYCESIINDKPPIILLHGFVSSTYTFKRLIPLLKEHFSVVAIDLPGFGRSEKSKVFVYSFENYAALVYDCINYFSFKDVILVGHSMGGQISLYLAKKHPELIKKMVLLCSSAYREKAKNSLRYSSYLPFFTFFARRWIMKKDINETLNNVFSNSSYIHDELIHEFSRPLKEKAFYCSLVRLLRHREGDLPSQELKKINVPTLLIWGEADKVVPFELGLRLSKDLPKAEIISYENTGHLITEERPRDIYKEIISYA